MANVKYGSIVTELKGKVGGQVFQGGNNGYVLRNKGYTPGNPSSNRQAANASLARNAKLWRTLSGGSVGSWNSIAASWPFVDRFGVTYYAPAFQVFMSWNGNLNALGLPSVTNATGVSSPTDPGAVTLVSPGAGQAELDWVNVGGANDYFIIYASPKLSNGRNNNNVRYRQVLTSDYNGVNSTAFETEYAAIWATLNTGDVISAKWAFYKRSFPLPSFTGSALLTIA